jgi:hypothetical protein
MELVWHEAEGCMLLMLDDTNVHVYVIILWIWRSGWLEVLGNDRCYEKDAFHMVRCIIRDVDFLKRVLEPDVDA